MWSRPHDLMNRALTMGYAIGAFNTSNLEIAQAIVLGAQAKKSPVIVQTSEGAIEYGGLATLKAMVQVLAEEVEVPVVMHLDHGRSVEIALKCIEAGYSSVMIDLSKLDFQENLKGTKQVVEVAHKKGVWVEGEIGAILGAEGLQELENDKTPDAMMTDPKQAAEFVERTGVDSLAVSVGTIHGAFSGREYIRFELLREIEKKLTGVPLVIHGASGIANQHLEEAAAMNVCKINVDTELRVAFEAAVKAYFEHQHDKLDPRKILGPARDAMQAVVEEKMEVFGSVGNA